MTISDCADDVSIKGQCFDIVVEEHEKNFTSNVIDAEDVEGQKFVRGKVLRLRLNQISMYEYRANITFFTNMITIVLILSATSIMKTSKLVMDSQALAQSISPFSIAINQLWNFFYIELGVFFFYDGASEFMDRVWMPFFAWVVVAAALESRLFIHVWKAQRAHRREYDWRRLMHREWMFTFILCMVGALSVVF